MKEEIISKEDYKDRWFEYNENGEINEVEKPKGLDDSCYFCGFDELKPEQHHIIRKCDGGRDTPSNRLPLCPNHHYLIHRRIYLLGYNPKKCFYFLVNRKSKNVIFPIKEQMENKRKLSYSSIKYSKNLEVTGDLKTKAVISVKDFNKRLHKNFKKKRCAK